MGVVVAVALLRLSPVAAAQTGKLFGSAAYASGVPLEKALARRLGGWFWRFQDERTRRMLAFAYRQAYQRAATVEEIRARRGPLR